MRKFISITIISLIGLTSCLIMINENDFRGLSKKDMNHVKSFDLNKIALSVNYTDSFYVYEINSNDIKRYAGISRYLWIHLWRPWCKANYCMDINYFASLANNYSVQGLNFLLISESYDLRSIKETIERNNYSKPIYVLQDSYYGHDLKVARKKFSEINNGLIKENDFLIYDDYIFKDTTLLIACKEINKIVIDSLLSLNMK